ncbi:MAG: helix-turn-helix domain-containing protein [Anaerolineae bacterium]|nr:helix-turn-helix domain-containing protein [Anaerolineae bacterium]
MSFSDVAAKLKKSGALEKEKATLEQKPLDLEELYTLRARMMGVLIRDARLAMGYTIEEIANHLNLPDETILAWEFGQAVPSLPQLELVAFLLQVPVSHFWGSDTFMQQYGSRQIDSHEYSILRDRMIGALIRAGRQAKNISTADLATKLGINAEFLEAYEYGTLPVPMTLLVSIASALEVNVNYFLESSSRVGEFLEIREALKTIEEMPEDIRAFLSSHTNQPYIRLAMIFAKLPADSLRALAESMLDITL